jgi:hypothetical protein
MQKSKNLKIWIFNAFRIIIILAAVYSVYQKAWINLLISSATFFLIYLPSILEKQLKIDYPEEFEILIMIFIFASLFLGEINYFSQRFWWWDIALHGVSGLIIAAFALSLVYVLNREKKINLNPNFIAIFTFSFALSLGAIWEIFEFAMDQFIGSNMQKSGLIDTMWDLILDSFGALIVSIIGLLHLKEKTTILTKIGKEFIEVNKIFYGNED